ncbi:GIY-YIG nuclease family protein [Candidatus Microgenomates bacterium]|nr:GIY-YIG nuclease family protein [Candidatus Microgenomates bacterium]
MTWYTYIARCRDDSLYTGITPDLQRREWLHNHKKGAKSLLGKLPVKIIYSEKFVNRILAAKREREIKRWKREKKLNLIRTHSLRSV